MSFRPVNTNKEATHQGGFFIFHLIHDFKLSQCNSTAVSAAVNCIVAEAPPVADEAR